MADAHALGACFFGSGGSSPLPGTNINSEKQPLIC